MIAHKTCPHCGHENLQRATYCFECHTCLQDKPTTPGMLPRHYGIYLSETAKPFEPLPVEIVEERRRTRDYQMHLDNGLVCLRCSAENGYNARHCHQCNALLNVPDEVYQLRAVGSAQSSIGQGRTVNEDEVGLWGRGNVLIAMVADGMGGAAAGEEASRFVREAIQACFTGITNGSEILGEWTETEIAQRLRDAANLANLAILERIQDDTSVKGMGTTFTAATIRGNRAVIAHVGDSRAYQIKPDGSIFRVTDDHSFVEVLIASGHITRHQAAIHPMRSVLYRALGHASSEMIDVYHIDIAAGERLVLCSDGLTRHLNSEEIARISLDTNDPSDIGEALLELANHRGGEDNISVAAVIVQADDSAVPLEELYPTPCDLKFEHATQAAQEGRSTLELPRYEDEG